MPTTTSRRVIQSTWAGSEIRDPEYIDQLVEAIDAIPATARVRRSETKGPGNWFARGFVAQYTDPVTGDTRWVECYADETGDEYADHATRESAETAYEDNVRNLQESTAGNYTADGQPECWWDTTDVDGVPTTGR